MLAVLSVVGLVYALAVAIGAWKVVRSVPLAARIDAPAPRTWPRVSVIVPACNEADSIEQAMRSRLLEEYPDAEYILVDDRSTDGTGAIIDALAREDRRIVALHVTALPEGWLGKMHAMQRGLERATGEYVLFSDADVHHEPGALARIVAHCEAHRIDHVAVMPWVWSSSFWLDVMFNAMVRLLALASRAWKVADPDSRVSIGGGNFNLVRRTALERAGGLEPLKLEVADDVALGQALKWSGARPAVFNARGLGGLYYYRSVGEAVRGMEKNSFAALGRYSIARFTLLFLVLVVVELGPIVALAGGGWTRVLAASALVLVAAAQAMLCRWLGRPLLPTLFMPVGIALNLFASLRSMWKTLLRGGVEWRGTHYSLEALRRGMRFTLL